MKNGNGNNDNGRSAEGSYLELTIWPLVFTTKNAILKDIPSLTWIFFPIEYICLSPSLKK